MILIVMNPVTHEDCWGTSCIATIAAVGVNTARKFLIQIIIAARFTQIQILVFLVSMFLHP